MPSRLKSLELHGYKTFASRTEFAFAGTITAIVGPNGSGKSNIADSIRWVLGEQSFSLLRGKKTEDMIFAGSEQRPRAGMASATITFDNTDGWLPIDFSEVAITRRAYRDGDNEYLINGQRVRLRDVSELLGRSGLSERTYTIIGQGLVDAALALKAEDRRRLFEEAAGIGLYRSRREEALRRLDTTRHNLERVQDILAELQPRLRSLERQARRVQEYEQIRADLRVLLREWYGYHWHAAQRELVEAREVARQQEAVLERVRASYSGLDEKLAGLLERIQNLRARLSSWHRQSAQLHNRRENLSRDLAVAEERNRSLQAQLQNGQAELMLLEGERSQHEERLGVVQKDLAVLQDDLEDAHQQVEEARRALQKRQNERATVEREIQNTRQSLGALNNRHSQLEARLAERRAQAQRQEDALQAACQAVAAAEKDLQAVEQRLQAALRARRTAEAARQSAEEALQAHRSQVGEIENELRTLQEKRAARCAEAARLQAQVDVLEQAERELTGYAAGTRLLLNAARQSRLKGVAGALSGMLEVSAEYETAIAAALGEYVDAVLLEQSGDSDGALDALAAEKSRGVLLPLNTLTPEVLAVPPAFEGALGLASDLVTVPPHLRPVVDLLLGRVWVARDRTVARRLLAQAREQGGATRVVTLRGEVFYVNGPITAGHESKAGVLARPRQRRELQTALEEADAQIAALDGQLQVANAELARLRAAEGSLRHNLEQARSVEKTAQNGHSQEDLAAEKSRRQLQWQREQGERLVSEIARGTAEARRMEEDLADVERQIADGREKLRGQNNMLAGLSSEELQSQVSHWGTRLAVAERAAADAQSRLQERKAALVVADRSLAGLQGRLGEYQAALQALESEMAGLRQSEGSVNREIEDLKVLIDPAETDLETLEKEQAGLQTTEADARQALSAAEHRHSQAKILLARRQEALEGLRQRVEDDFGLVAFQYASDVSGPTPLPLDGLVEQLPMHKDLADLPADIEENIKNLRAQLRRMGPINPEAQTEYEQVKERFEFLNMQVADLNTAENNIKEVIVELDVLMQREFRKTFDAVAQEFRQTFTRLFGGGTAKLVLTDPQDLTLTGIDIEARLPGRREQGLSLLSGGERSLTAVALVFSLLKVSPTPFCVLDEVDAMLDEANVGRFRDLLQELSGRTQFAIITHNRNTVQVADTIYGITMGVDSASQMVSLKLDEVSKIVE